MSVLQDFAARPGVAVVFGASGGLGSVIARTLGERGSRLALTYRSASPRSSTRIDPLLARHGERAQAYRLDLTDAAACAALARAVGDDGVHTVVYASGPHVFQCRCSAAATSTSQ